MWVSLIPNSQVVVMPYPLEKPKSWQVELSVHPSRSFTNILIVSFNVKFSTLETLLEDRNRQAFLT